MSNIYNKELEQALTKVNDQLYQQTLAETNKEQAAKLNLYYAHGLTEKAYNKLMNDTKESGASGLQYHKASQSDEVITNVVTSSTAAATDSNNAKAAVSTAAVNIQGAANSLSNLAGDVSRALSVATAKDYGDKINQLVTEAFALTQNAADSAEDTSIDSLNATIEAAQTRATGALSQSQVVSGNIKSLVTLLQGEFNTLQDTVATDLENLKSAQENENAQAGIYRTALTEENSLKESKGFINDEVNFGLIADTSVSTEGYKFAVSFDSLIPPASSAIEQGNRPKSLNRMVKKLMPTQKDIAEYRVILATYDDAATFDIRAAKSTPDTNYYSFNFKDGTQRYKKKYSVTYFTSEYKVANPNETGLNIAIDYKGNPVKRGMPYVFFVYAIYTNAFQSKTEDTAGYLTLPSPQFTLLTSLPTIAEGNGPHLSFYNTYKNAKKVPSARVTFKISKEALTSAPGVDDLSKIMEFRCFILSDQNYRADQSNKKLDKEIKKLFDLEAELRKAEERYLATNDKYQKAIALGDLTSKKLKALEKLVTRTKKRYETVQKKYKTQDAKVNRLNIMKVSNFFIDNDIVKQIPDADGIVAKKDATFFELLKAQLDDYKIDQASTISKQQAESTIINDAKSEIALNSSLIEEETANINKLTDELDNINKGILKDREAIAKILEDNESLLQMLIDDGLPIDNIDNLIEVIAELELMELEAMPYLINLHQDIEKVIDVQVLKAEKEEILDAAQQALNDSETVLQLAEAQAAYWKKELDGINERINNINVEISQLGGETAEAPPSEEEGTEGKSAGKKKKSPAKKTNVSEDVQYVATVVGDIVDNYGEPMLGDTCYRAFVYSMIDQSKEPLAFPLFAPAISDFSSEVEYKLEVL